MDIKALKDKILQLAIQGKLVHQDENDEPALVLLERIKEEKEQLIKDKVIKKEKPLPEISEDEKLFELPTGWEWCRLGSIVINHDSKRKPVSVKDRENLSKIYDYYGATGPIDKVDKYIFDGFYLLIGEDGGNFFTEKDVAFTVNGKFWPNNHVHVLEGLDDVTTNYLKYFLNSLNLKDLGVITGIAVPKLNQANLNNIMISIPPLQEQKRIVAKVDSLFKLIDELNNNKQDLLQNISDVRNKVLQLAIQGKLVYQCENDESASTLLEKIKEQKEQLIKDKVIRKEKPLPEITDDEKSFDLPDGWEWCRLGDIGIYKKGPFGSTITKRMFVPKSDDTVKVYEQKNAIQKDWKLGEYYVTKEYFEEKLKGFEVFEGDIIVSCAGTIGETYIMPSGIEKGVINQALMKMKLFDGINVDYFLMYFDFILKETSKESSKGSAIKNIPPFDIFKKMLLPLPPIEEQKRIIAKVGIIMKYLDTLEKQIN